MFEEVCTILADQLNVAAEDIRMDSRIKDDLGADSLDILQLLMTIEEEKGVTIPDEELATFSTVGDIVNYLEKQA
jgi:acyl carrier protein